MVNPYGQGDPTDGAVTMEVSWPDGVTHSMTVPYGGGITRWGVPPGNLTIHFSLASDPGTPAAYEARFLTAQANGFCSG